MTYRPTKADLAEDLRRTEAILNLMDDRAIAARHVLACHAGLGGRRRAVAKALALLDGSVPADAPCGCVRGS